MGLGPVADISLAEARELARANRKLLLEGIDPIEARRRQVASNLAAKAAMLTFDQAAERYIAQHRASWKNDVHARQWTSTLKQYASPKVGRLSVADITDAHVLEVLNPIWQIKPETASRVRGRIEKVLGWATVSKYRSGDNPARWRGHLDNLLPAPKKIRPVKHQAALPYDDMPAFVAELRERQGVGALALEFTILTCVRTADVRNAKTEDIDTGAAIWTIPSFTKTGTEHVVPLSKAAIVAFEKARRIAEEVGGAVGASPFAFPNDVTGGRLSENAMLAVLDRMGRKGSMTTHGCRSSFRTWAQERTNFPWDVAEMSLGHTVGNSVERAYARGKALKKRTAIMQAWADFCEQPKADGRIVPIRKGAAA
jgi:integrase